MTLPTTPSRPRPTPPQAAPLLKIHEVAAETGLTTRAIRYYEEIGLLEPAGRSDGDYRLYDACDLDRLQFIRSLRDDAGFSLAQIGQLLEDEAARERNRERFRQTGDPDERRALLVDRRARVRPPDRDPRGQGRPPRDDDRRGAGARPSTSTPTSPSSTAARRRIRSARRPTPGPKPRGRS